MTRSCLIGQANVAPSATAAICLPCKPIARKASRSFGVAAKPPSRESIHSTCTHFSMLAGALKLCPFKSRQRYCFLWSFVSLRLQSTWSWVWSKVVEAMQKNLHLVRKKFVLRTSRLELPQSGATLRVTKHRPSSLLDSAQPWRLPALQASQNMIGPLWAKNGWPTALWFSTLTPPKRTRWSSLALLMIRLCIRKSGWKNGKRHWTKPNFVKMKVHKLPGGKTLKVKCGTQLIDRCWKFIKESLSKGAHVRAGMSSLQAQIRTAQYEHWSPQPKGGGPIMWISNTWGHPQPSQIFKTSLFFAFGSPDSKRRELCPSWSSFGMLWQVRCRFSAYRPSPLDQNHPWNLWQKKNEIYYVQISLGTS